MTSPKTLSRDFKHVKRHAPGGVIAVNGWIGFGIGLSVGLAVALAVHLHHYRDQAAVDVPQPAAEAPPASSTAPTVEPPQATDTAAAYDFYDMLPKQEVEVPGVGEKGANPAARSALPQGDVTLQAGSFKQPDEADKLQARLAKKCAAAHILPSAFARLLLCDRGVRFMPWQPSGCRHLWRAFRSCQ